MASVAEQVRSKNEQFMDAFRRRDTAAIAAMYSADARLLPPGAEIISGGSSIEAFWREAINAGLSEAKFETIDVDLIGGYTAVEVGRFTIYVGKSVSDRGKYVVIWRNEDGQWKLHRDIWNSSMPAARRASAA